MEFENDQPISDEERQLAEARQLTLEPLHSDIRPEELPELEAIASERATKTQQNSSNDTEDTAQQDQLLQPVRKDLAEKTIMQPAMPRKRHTGIIVGAIIIALILIVAFWLIQLK